MTSSCRVRDHAMTSSMMPSRIFCAEGIEALPQQVAVLPAETGAVREFIVAHCGDA